MLLLELLLFIVGVGVRELAAIVTEDVSVNFTTLFLAVTAYTAGKTKKRLEHRELLPMTILGLGLRIKRDVEKSQRVQEGLCVLAHLILAIAFDQEVNESLCLDCDTRIVSVVHQLLIIKHVLQKKT